MAKDRITYRGGPIFDGRTLLHGHSLVVEDDQIVSLAPSSGADDENEIVDLEGDYLCPGFVDLQVNGGGGVMFNADPAPETLSRMAKAHGRLGATTILPTLITDTPDKTRAAIEAAKIAVAAQTPGIGGLHLEGPHLSAARKGAHDANLIRPMQDRDLEVLLDAARTLPALMVTVAPENVTKAQVAALSHAGAVISLGHSNADFQTCIEYAEAGAACVTHLFNAMSQLGNREPGLVGAALASGKVSAGLIADAIHVHPSSMRAAWAAKQGPGSIFLVSDSMACAGSDITSFEIEGRLVNRSGGRLTLADGTLAGADLALARAIKVMVEDVGVDVVSALRAATDVPARLMRMPHGAGRLAIGGRGNFIRLGPDFELRQPVHEARQVGRRSLT